MIPYIVFLFLLSIAFLRYTPQFRIAGTSVWLLPIGFSIKILVGFFFLYIYIFHYGTGELTADSKAFFADSKELNDIFYHSKIDYLKFLIGADTPHLINQYLSETTQWDAGSEKWFNDTRNIIRLHSIIHFFSFGNIFIHLLVTSFIAIAGLRLMVIAIQPYIKTTSTIAFSALLFMPNALFWSASILKEPLIFFSIGLFLYAILGVFSGIKKVILVLLSVLALVSIKPYILLCIIPALVVYQLFQKSKSTTNAIIKLAIGTGALIALLFVFPNNPVIKKLSNQQLDFNNLGKGGVYARADTCIYIIHPYDVHYLTIDKEAKSVFLNQPVKGEYILVEDKFKRNKCTIYPNSQPWILYFDGELSGSYIETTLIANSPIQLIKNIPEALSNTLLRPFPSDPPHTKYKWFSIIDTWLLHFILLAVLIFYRRKLTAKEFHLVIAFGTFAIVLALLIGWTTPVIGAIIRYKLPVQLALMIITLILVQPKKLKNG